MISWQTAATSSVPLNPVDGDERRHQVFARSRPPVRDQPGQVAGQLPRHRVQLLTAVAVADHERRDPLPVGFRHTQQLADHRDRQRPGVRVEQVSGGPARRHRVQQVRGDPFGTQPQLRGPPGRERLLHRAA
jgi:hypothetical protein